MTRKATITIGMPVYNNAETVERAVRSVQAQSRADWQLIITDDRSSDGSWDIVQALARADARIEAVQNQERRVFLNFKQSLNMADTAFFTWLAADDYWGPEFLALTWEALSKHPDAVSAIPACQYTDAAGGPYLPSLTTEHSRRLRTFLAAPGGTRMYGLARTEVLRRAFPSRGMHAYDWYLMLGVLKAGPQITLPIPQLYRSKTPVAAYVEDAGAQRGLYRRFPVLDMSLAALRAGLVPWRNWGDLLALNLRKHEEFVAYNRPKLFLRMRWFYRFLGLPIARSDKMTSEAAGDGAAVTAPKTVPPAQAKGKPRLVAVLTCRNAEPTLACLLDSLGGHGAEVVVIDNGSTDATRAIADARLRDGPVVEVRDDPFHGYFDLTRQLHLKRDLMRQLSADWFIHADADEFLGTPDGRPLQSYLADVSEHTRAFLCDELMFLPEDDDTAYSAADFQETMRAHVHMAERNLKERAFRASSNLDRWLETGGHTVTDGGVGRAVERLSLRHYFALSLDQVRAEYLSRVYAARDLAKFWHGARRTEAVEIVAPSPGLLVTQGTPKTVRSVPVFAPRLPVFHAAPPKGTDLALVADPAILPALKAAISDALPGVRLHCGLGPPPLPHLHVVRHPGAQAGADDVAAGEDWVRRIAGARQHALVARVAFRELRLEDIEDTRLRELLAGLVLGQGGSPFLRRDDLDEHRHAGFQGRLKAVTGGLAADFNYA